MALPGIGIAPGLPAFVGWIIPANAGSIVCPAPEKAGHGSDLSGAQERGKEPGKSGMEAAGSAGVEKPRWVRMLVLVVLRGCALPSAGSSEALGSQR